MKQLSDADAALCGIHAVHHEMENGETRFRLVSEHGSSYILTRSSSAVGWQKSHVHYKKQEFYILEKGTALLALWIGNEVQIKTLCENDTASVPIGVPHNVLLLGDAILHTVKYGTQEEDWHSFEELDAALALLNIQKGTNS